MFSWYPLLPGHRSGVRNTFHHVHAFHGPDSGRYKGIDILQDLLQGGLLLGTRAVNTRTCSEYNCGLFPRLRRLADSKGAAIT